MLDEWTKSTLLSLFKKKEAIQNYKNYHGIKLMSRAIKLCEIIEQKLNTK